MKPTKNKSFDPVEMKRRIQREIRHETEGMTSTELVEYFRKGAEEGPFGELLKKHSISRAAAKSK